MPARTTLAHSSRAIRPVGCAFGATPHMKVFQITCHSFENSATNADGTTCLLSTRFRVRIPVAPTCGAIAQGIEREVSSNPCRRTHYSVARNGNCCGNQRWRRGQESNLHSLAAGGFQDRCNTIMRPLRSGWSEYSAGEEFQPQLNNGKALIRIRIYPRKSGLHP